MSRVVSFSCQHRINGPVAYFHRKSGVRWYRISPESLRRLWRVADKLVVTGERILRPTGFDYIGWVAHYRNPPDKHTTSDHIPADRWPRCLTEPRAAAGEERTG